VQSTTSEQYKLVQITTANPGEVLVALYDGLFRFLLVAKHMLPMPGKRGQAGEAMSRAHAIVSELYTGLDRAAYPELVDNLSRVYEYCLGRITHANIKNDAKAIDDVIRVLTPIREGFAQVVKNTSKEELEALREANNAKR
jgi:flagellar protein FliS